jgi:hypothetical protein
MKSRKEKRTEAIARLEASTYENSKAKRLKTATEKQWQAKKTKDLNELKTRTSRY